MKLVENIVSLYRPEAVVYTEDLVKVRENIKDITVVDELFNTEKSAYMYDEKVYTKEEYDEMKWESEIAEIKNDIKDVKENIEILELAIAEMLEEDNEVQETVNGKVQTLSVAVASLNTIYTKYSAIAQMYANMIEKGIYTIDRVPSRWKSEVEAVLEENKED